MLLELRQSISLSSLMTDISELHQREICDLQSSSQAVYICRNFKMADVASASAGLVQALKGNDAENLLTAIQAGLIFQDKPGDDRQRLRGKFYFGHPKVPFPAGAGSWQCSNEAAPRTASPGLSAVKTPCRHHESAR